MVTSGMYISLTDAMQRLDRMQADIFLREKIAKQSGAGTMGDLQGVEGLSQKALTGSWAAHAMGFVWPSIREWIANAGDQYGLARKVGTELVLQPAEKLHAEMDRLIKVQFCFATASLRASAGAPVDYFLGQAMQQFKEKCRKQYDAYAKDLRSLGNFWFRRSPEEQLWTGMHTALSAHFKMAETCASVLCQLITEGKQENITVMDLQKLFSQAANLVTYVATCHLEVLHGVEGYVWDHAATEAMRGFRSTDDMSELLVSTEMVTAAEKKLEKAKSVEHRTGCPAFMAMTEEGTVMKEVQRWCQAIIEEYYWPAVVRHAPSIAVATA